MQKPNVYEYTDFRAFLKDLMAFKHEENPACSARWFSRHAGFSSPNFMWFVMNGKRNMGIASIRKVARALKLRKDESEFFEHMVLMNQATTHEEKNHYYRLMTSSKKYLKVHQLESDQYEFYSKWYYTAIREMVTLPDFRENPAWIARKLKPGLTAEEVRATLLLLLRLKLVERGKDGRLRQTEPNLATPPTVKSLSVANFHREMIKRAHDSIELSPARHRDISSLTITLSPERFDLAKKKITAFRRELFALLAEQPEGDTPDAVYQINFQLFNLSEVGNE